MTGVPPPVVCCHCSSTSHIPPSRSSTRRPLFRVKHQSQSGNRKIWRRCKHTAVKCLPLATESQSPMGWRFSPHHPHHHPHHHHHPPKGIYLAIGSKDKRAFRFDPNLEGRKEGTDHQVVCDTWQTSHTHTHTNTEPSHTHIYLYIPHHLSSAL
jgi:hypothetical protein